MSVSRPPLRGAVTKPGASIRREASLRSAIEPFYAMEVMREAAALAAAGRDIVRMEIGQPGGPAPLAARRAAAEALDRPLGYTVALGLPELRGAIADLYRRRHGLTLDPERVVITTGSSAGFQLAFLSIMEEGGRLVMADPGYPSYRGVARALGVEPVGLPCLPEERFQPTPARLAAAAEAGPIDAVLAASPANPTGAMLGREALKALIEATEALGAAFISDEIYHGLHYAEPAATALEFSDEAFVINSFSKYFAMTGWRIGWMVAPARFVRAMERLSQNLYICPPHVSQVAALAALSAEAEPELEARRAGYARSRAHLLEVLPGVGLPRFAPPDGAFYLYADVSARTADSDEWCRALLREAGVAATPGRDFDPARGRAHVRFSFAGEPERIEEGARRIGAFLKG